MRNLEDRVHRKLKLRAAKSGTTLSDYVKGVLERELAQPTLAELSARLRRLPPARLEPSPEELIRADRDRR